MRGRSFRQAVPLIVAAALAAFAFGWSSTFDEVPPMLVRSFQPSRFPQLVSGLIIALAVLGLVRLVAGAETEEIGHVPPAFYRTVLVLALAGLVTAVGDFLLALMVGSAGIAAAWGERRAAVLLGLGLVAPILVIIFFDQALQIRFPRGFLLNFYYG